MAISRLQGRLRQAASRFRRMLLGNRPLILEWGDSHPESWLRHNLPNHNFRPPELALAQKIEAIALETQTLGPQPLWQGYREAYNRNPNLPWADEAMVRTSEQVRSQPIMGGFFSWVAAVRSARLIVEVGTAFGISGMYWLAGLQASNGHLITFDPNDVWHKIAKSNMSRIGDNFTAVCGTVEAEMQHHLMDVSIDIAFVDAIHTSEFVESQLALLLPRMTPGGIVILDDIGFSEDMAQCWKRVSKDQKFSASVAIDRRVGVLEMKV